MNSGCSGRCQIRQALPLEPKTLAHGHGGDRARDPQEAPSPSQEQAHLLLVGHGGSPDSAADMDFSSPQSLPPRHGDPDGQHGCFDLILLTSRLDLVVVADGCVS